MRRDHLNALVSQSRIQSIRVIGSVPDESLRSGLDPSVFQGGFYEGDFVRRSLWMCMASRGLCHELLPLPSLVGPTWSPLFSPDKQAIDEIRSHQGPRAHASCAAQNMFKGAIRYHCWNRRWQVWYRIAIRQVMPRRPVRSQNHSARLQRHGRPRPSHAGRSGDTIDPSSSKIHKRYLRKGISLT